MTRDELAIGLLVVVIIGLSAAAIVQMLLGQL